jgi:hypothetical protein
VYKLVIRKRANTEAIEAAGYYEDKQIGLGFTFLENLSGKYEELIKNPELYGFVSEKYRGVRIDGFPYLLIFKIYENRVIVYMVHNTHKKPRY